MLYSRSTHNLQNLKMPQRGGEISPQDFKLSTTQDQAER
jgi:hypothetical protein